MHHACIHRVYESDRYWHFTTQNARHTSAFQDFYLYDKTRNQILAYAPRPVTTKSEIQIGYYNDWDGGLALVPDFVDDNKVIGYYQSFEFIKRYNQGYRLEICDTDSDVCEIRTFRARSDRFVSEVNQENLRNLVRTFSDHDNPILMVMELR
ncbi:MAG: hypothetical protein R2751_10355 [Bacteroidales bacterium]